MSSGWLVKFREALGIEIIKHTTSTLGKNSKKVFSTRSNHILLSKSQYIRGLQCHKSLWLYKHKRELRSAPDSSAETLFNIGYTVGSYATDLFPGGVEIEFTPNDFDGMSRKTADLIEQGVETIYEATFNENGIFAMVDVLHKSNGKWNIYEVKASTTVKEYHRDDAAIQYYALSQVLDIGKIFLVHINNQYTRQGELDVCALFNMVDITDEVLEKQVEIKGTLNSFDAMLQSDMPAIDIGPHCSDPYGCDFHAHCWQDIPDYSVFNLYRMSGTKKFELYYGGIINFEDIPSDIDLTETQHFQVEASTNPEIRIDKTIIGEFLDTLEYPISFLDFETFQNAVPRFSDQRPYMQMTFQYSLQVMTDSGELSHEEYLGDENIDPRRELSERMLRHLPPRGSIMAYNQSFEKGRIKELAALFPDLRDELLSLLDRFVDLIAPFRRLGYYHPDFNGSFSIKSVLPALFPDDPELDYSRLEIHDGGMAMDTFANLHLLKDSNQREKIRKDLLAYCQLDTLAMVRIWEKLKTAV